jgi:glycosyltransferase involved in cell wall biosynthesis
MERAMYELVKRAYDRVEFTVVATTLAPELRPYVRWRRVPAIRRPFVLKYAIFFIGAGLRYRRRDGTLVHTLGAILPRAADVMAVHFCHAAYRADTKGADLESGQPWIRRANVALAFRLGLVTERLFTTRRWARVVTAVSRGGAREIERFYPGLDTVVIPNGVDQERFRPCTTTRREVRDGAGVAPGEVVALFVGGRWSQKGLEVAIEGLARAAELTTTPLSLWIAGRGDVARYRSIAAGLGVGKQVRFHGYRSDLERLYQAADIFLLPSSYETFCMAAYEAASSGLPVIATNVNGIDDLLQDGTAGVLVDASPEAIASSLARLADDPALRTSMGAAGRRQTSHYNWDVAVDQTLALYDRLRSSPGEDAAA